MTKEIYKVGYARRGALNTYWNHASFPVGISGEDLHLSEMIPADEARCIVYKPLNNDWYLLAGVHRGTDDRSAPVVAARLFNRPAAEELFSKPEKLLRLGLFLRDCATAASVESYQYTEPETSVSVTGFPTLGNDWKPDTALPERVELLVYGYLNVKAHNTLHFIDASPADLHAALTLVPVALSVESGFSLPFNAQPGCCTDLNLLPGGDAPRMLDEMGQGWPNKTRVALTPGCASNYQELRLAAEAILNMPDRAKWQKVFGRQGAPQTRMLLFALGAVQEAQQAGHSRAAAADILVRTLRIEKQNAQACVQELDKLLGREETPTHNAARSTRAGTSADGQSVRTPSAQRRTEHPPEQKRSRRDRDRVWTVVLVVAVAVLALLFAAALLSGGRELTLRLALDVRSAVILLSALAAGFCLGRYLP